MVGEDTKFVLYRICKESILQRRTTLHNSSSPKSEAQLSSLRRHWREERRKKGRECQISLVEASEQVQIWDINKSSCITVHQRVTEMMALDSQPFLWWTILVLHA